MNQQIQLTNHNSREENGMRITIVGIIAIAALMGFSAEAQTLKARQDVQIRTIEAQPDGTDMVMFKPAVKVAPGDTVRYMLAYDNTSPAPVEAAVLTMPVPESMIYVPGSSAHPATEVALSVDYGGTFLSEEAVQEIIENSAGEQQITHVRWTFAEDITSGASGSVAYLAMLK